jgi:hypothetical protein
MRQTLILPPPRLPSRRVGLCRLSPVPAARWTFPVLSPLILPWVSGPVPRWVPVVLSPVSSHGNIGLLQALSGSTFPPHSRKATSHGGSISGLQSFHYVQTPRFARHPGRSYHSSLLLGSCDFYTRASHDSLPYHAPDMLNVRTGQLTFGDFHPTRSAALPAAHKAPDRFHISKFHSRSSVLLFPFPIFMLPNHLFSDN